MDWRHSVRLWRHWLLSKLVSRRTKQSSNPKVCLHCTNPFPVGRCWLQNFALGNVWGTMWVFQNNLQKAISLYLLTSEAQRLQVSTGKVMFSQVSVCPWGEGEYPRGWWISQVLCPGRIPTPWYWHLMAVTIARTIGKWAVRILLECFLVFMMSSTGWKLFLCYFMHRLKIICETTGIAILFRLCTEYIFVKKRRQTT